MKMFYTLNYHSYFWRTTMLRNLCILVTCFMLIPSTLQGQVETNPEFDAANHWIFGKNVYIEFVGNSVLEHRFNGINYLEGTSNYFDGTTIYHCYNGGIASRSDSNVYYNSTRLNDQAAQGTILLKHRECDSIYVLGSGRTGGAGYDILINDSTISPLVMFPMNGGEKQQGINHQNGRDIWYANHAREGDSVFFYLLMKDGILECPVVAHTGLNYYGGPLGFSTQGQMKFSPDGKYLAEVVSSDPFGYGIYTFNQEYPTLDSVYIFEKGFTPDYTKRWPYGLAFSPDSKTIYISAGRANDIQEIDYPPVLYQVSIDSMVHDHQGDKWISIDTFWNIDEGALQLGPNGKIYHAIPYQNYVGVIHAPNEPGSACNYVRQGIAIDSGGRCNYGLPTFNQSYFYTPAIDFHYEENCISNTYEFWGLDTFSASNLNWRFTNLETGNSSQLSGKDQHFTFPDVSIATKYEVTFMASSSTLTDSVTKTITIRPRMQSNFLGKDTFYCSGDSSFSLTLSTPADLHCIHWNGLEPYISEWRDTIIGYENFYGHISSNQTLTVDTAGLYFARITNKAFCTLSDSVLVEEKPIPNKPEVNRNNFRIESSITSHAYRWYRNGSLAFETNINSYDPDSNGYYQIQLISEFGCKSEWSDSFYVGFASIPQLSKDKFSIYPNPSTGIFTVEGICNDFKIEVFTMQGKMVLEQDNHAVFKLITNGNYTVRITTNDYVQNTIVTKIE